MRRYGRYGRQWPALHLSFCYNPRKLLGPPLASFSKICCSVWRQKFRQCHNMTWLKQCCGTHTLSLPDHVISCILDSSIAVLPCFSMTGRRVRLQHCHLCSAMGTCLVSTPASQGAREVPCVSQRRHGWNSLVQSGSGGTGYLVVFVSEPLNSEDFDTSWCQWPRDPLLEVRIWI